MLEQYKKNQDKVWHILNTYEETRDSDKLLWLAYLVIFHDLKGILGLPAYVKLRDVVLATDTPTMESIRRIRQKIQEHGEFRGKLYEDRHREADDMHEHFSDELKAENPDHTHE